MSGATGKLEIQPVTNARVREFGLTALKTEIVAVGQISPRKSNGRLCRDFQNPHDSHQKVSSNGR